MKVLFCSDLHLGHKLAAKKRGFDCVHEHDRHVIDRLKHHCNKRTILWVLGDVAMNLDSLQLLKEVEGGKILVKGNHDNFKLDEYLDIFYEIHGIIKYKGMWITHCPIHPQEMFRAKANVHGHIHKDAASENIGFPYINVNWDFWDKPIYLEDIRAMVEKEDAVF